MYISTEMAFLFQVRWKLLFLDVNSRVNAGGHPGVTSDPEAGTSRKPVYVDGGGEQDTARWL